MTKVEWCTECGRAKGIGCACNLSFAEKIRTLKANEFSLLDRDRQRAHPKNKGRDFRPT